MGITTDTAPCLQRRSAGRFLFFQDLSESMLVIPTNFYSGFFYFYMRQKIFLGFLSFSHFLYRIFDLVIFFSLPSNPIQQPITQPNNQSPSLANDPPTTSQHCFSFSVNRYVLTAGSLKDDYFFYSKNHNSVLICGGEVLLENVPKGLNIKHFFMLLFRSFFWLVPILRGAAVIHIFVFLFEYSIPVILHSKLFSSNLQFFLLYLT